MTTNVLKTHVNVESVVSDAADDDDDGDVDVDNFRHRFLQPRLGPAARKTNFINTIKSYKGLKTW